MNGVNRHTGAALRADDDGHLRQSVNDILSTPLGSRVMRRDYGSSLPELVDQPLNALTTLRLYAATALALLRWEPRIRLRRVRLEPGAQAALDVSMSAAADGAAVLRLEVTRVDRTRRPALTLIHPLAPGAA